MRADAENASPPHRVTRSQANRSAGSSQDACKNRSIGLTKGRIPLVEISANERHSAEMQRANTPPQTQNAAESITLLSSGKPPIKQSQALSQVSLVVIPDTPEARVTKEGRGASKLKIANVPIPKTPEKKEATTQEGKMGVQQQQDCKLGQTEAVQTLAESPQTPTAPKANRQSVRRSLMGRPSMNCRASLAERSSLSAKRERLVQKSIASSSSKRKTARRSSAACKCMGSMFPHQETTGSGFVSLIHFSVRLEVCWSLFSHSFVNLTLLVIWSKGRFEFLKLDIWMIYIF